MQICLKHAKNSTNLEINAIFDVASQISEKIPSFCTSVIARQLNRRFRLESFFFFFEAKTVDFYDISFELDGKCDYNESHKLINRHVACFFMCAHFTNSIWSDKRTKHNLQTVWRTISHGLMPAVYLKLINNARRPSNYTFPGWRASIPWIE